MSGEICAIFMSSSPREPAEIKTCCDAKSSGPPPLPLMKVVRRSAFRISHGGQQRNFGMPGIEPGVLQDDRHIRFEYRGVVGIARDRRGVVEVVETQMQRSACGNSQPVRADGIAISEKNRDRHMCVT